MFVQAVLVDIYYLEILVYRVVQTDIIKVVLVVLPVLQIVLLMVLDAYVLLVPQDIF